MKTYVRSCFAAWMLLSAMAVRGQTTRPGETRPAFESDIEAFEAADRANPPPKDAVLFIGSSSIRMWKSLAEDFPGMTVINRGFGGSTIPDSIRYAGRIVVPYHPRRIVLYAGDNDIALGATPERIAADFRQFVERVRRDLPDVPIDFISIKPSLARWRLVEKMKQANALVQAYAKRATGIGYIDVFTPMLGEDGLPRRDLFLEDGLHLNKKGYQLWTGIVRERLK